MPTHPSHALPILFYQDVRNALTWLEETYGFNPIVVFEDDAGAIVHAEMMLGSAHIMLGPAGMVEWAVSPQKQHGWNTQQTYIYVDDVDAHHVGVEMMRGVTATVPEKQFYGDKTYRTTDIEGHRWIFAERIKTASKEEMAKATGLTVR
ncbi:VOC family protein [Paremcibacter congregatus]|uniref:Glyoxalase n=1 Tax=Paremcibacter congregatus TaxID=2043170 RepID=A0A2G4YN37_9PROT|nr:VOC family protein [Paremcibacter congregatus]PHZ83731.1 glyoxalase [Paremcibacter congregatus]QDE27432.1 VOC family protein [Paremcibacter congregatus]